MNERVYLTPYKVKQRRIKGLLPIYFRSDIKNNEDYAVIFIDINFNSEWIFCLGRVGGSENYSTRSYKTVNEAKEQLDCRLIKEGCILLTEEQYEKMVILI